MALPLRVSAAVTTDIINESIRGWRLRLESNLVTNQITKWHIYGTIQHILILNVSSI